MAVTAAQRTQQRKRLTNLEVRARMIAKSKRDGLPVVEPTRLDVLYAHAWIAYEEVRMHRHGYAQFGLQESHEHQLLRVVAFSITARFHPERLTDPERAELHRIFAAESPEQGPGPYAWNEDKHPDALALYLELRAGEYL
ncbi:hypothetical protein [Arthrobacter pityocampae]|uniref:hypothetical protein n=1 Tax=Arthrobacter pityocampae TaxID=547334 RepID=UPI003735872A